VRDRYRAALSRLKVWMNFIYGSYFPATTRGRTLHGSCVELCRQALCRQWYTGSRRGTTRLSPGGLNNRSTHFLGQCEHFIAGIETALGPTRIATLRNRRDYVRSRTCSKVLGCRGQDGITRCHCACGYSWSERRGLVAWVQS